MGYDKTQDTGRPAYRPRNQNASSSHVEQVYPAPYKIEVYLYLQSNLDTTNNYGAPNLLVISSCWLYSRRSQ